MRVITQLQLNHWKHAFLSTRSVCFQPGDPAEISLRESEYSEAEAVELFDRLGALSYAE
jgi:hypothetical protein